MKYIMFRLLSLALAAAVLITAVLPVTAKATEHQSSWIELLETATVNDSGSNLARVEGKTGIFRIKTPQYMRLAKIDLILSHASGYAPSSVRVRYNNVYYTLSRVLLDDYTTRFYGDLPDNLYADLVIEINKSYNEYTLSYQFLTCKVSSLVTNEFVADSYSVLGGGNEYCPFIYTQAANPEGDNLNYAFQFPVVVTDWEKYDKIVVSGSIDKLALNSVRCTLGGLGLPYEITYTVTNSGGSDSVTYEDSETTYFEYDNSYFTSTEGKTFDTSQYTGKVLFTITIDLTGLDRTNVNDLYIYFTCLANDYNGFLVQIVGVTGHIYVADTSDTSWWARFTSFFTDLFGGESGKAEDFETDMEQQGQQVQEDSDIIDTVTRPALEDVDVDIGQYIDPSGTAQASELMEQLFSNNMVLTMVMISLMVALAAFVIFGRR